MNNYDEEFLNIFNEYYPFERYIINTPKPINYIFDDALLTEVFVPETEIKPILDSNGNLVTYTRINPNEIYVKIMGPCGVMRFGYFDFSETIRETIRHIIIQDMNDYNYESLYVNHEEGNSEVTEMLNKQYQKIKDTYGECKIKDAVRNNLIQVK